MLWVTGQTRPDLAYNVCCLRMSLHEPKIKDLIKANKVLKKMQRSAVKIRFRGLTSRNNPFKIIVFTDSSLGNGPNGSTMAGHIMYLTDGSA